ncbi:ABC transporter substrate-binding protein [Alishewanella sp. d11]|uniref:ABC transporter substrate-binding protein n=1 Tax=Alishewanella sp. d11 TaxID=3414030 RepID=UPI003BF865B4
MAKLALFGWLIILQLVILATTYAATAPKVLFVSPSHPDDPFFKHVELYTKLAAENLGLELDIIYGEGNRLLQLEQLTSYFSLQQPEYIAVQTYSGGAKALMDFLAQYPATNIITLERIILPHESLQIGVPGEKYPNWFAEIYFDNAKASRTLTEALLNQCRDKAFQGQKGVVGLNGANGFEAEQRGAALKNVTETNFSYIFNQVVPSQWLRELATTQSQQLLRRYPNTSVIWAASDWIALGVLDMLKANQLNSADFCIGGFDWLPEAIAKIDSGELVASVGGHYMMGAWSMVAIYDHWHGNLPINALKGKAAFELELITAKNVQDYQPLLTPAYWQQYDFRRFSFTANPQQESYSFKLKQVSTTN